MDRAAGPALACGCQDAGAGADQHEVVAGVDAQASKTSSMSMGVSCAGIECTGEDPNHLGRKYV